MKSYGSSSSWQRGRQREASFACESPAPRPVSTAGVRSLRRQTVALRRNRLTYPDCASVGRAQRCQDENGSQALSVTIDTQRLTAEGASKAAKRPRRPFS